MPFKYEDGGQTMSFEYVDTDTFTHYENLFDNELTSLSRRVAESYAKADVDACIDVYHQFWVHPLPRIKKVIFNGPATIILWADKSKTVVKCMDGETFDKEKGLAMAICKKLFDNDFHKMFKEWCSK